MSFERMSLEQYRREVLKQRPAASMPLGRPRRGVPNKWEQAYYDECLRPLMLAGQIAYVEFEQWTCILVPPGAGDTSLRYTPDWHVIWASGLHEFVEVKGQERRSGTDRWKHAADKFPWADWRMVTKRKDGWETLRYRPAVSHI